MYGHKKDRRSDSEHVRARVAWSPLGWYWLKTVISKEKSCSALRISTGNLPLICAVCSKLLNFNARIHHCSIENSSVFNTNRYLLSDGGEL